VACGFESSEFGRKAGKLGLVKREAAGVRGQDTSAKFDDEAFFHD
jgi:hypothetical protein